MAPGSGYPYVPDHPSRAWIRHLDMCQLCEPKMDRSSWPSFTPCVTEETLYDWHKNGLTAWVAAAE